MRSLTDMYGLALALARDKGIRKLTDETSGFYLTEAELRKLFGLNGFNMNRTGWTTQVDAWCELGLVERYGQKFIFSRPDDKLFKNLTSTIIDCQILVGIWNRDDEHQECSIVGW